MHTQIEKLKVYFRFLFFCLNIKIKVIPFRIQSVNKNQLSQKNKNCHQVYQYHTIHSCLKIETLSLILRFQSQGFSYLCLQNWNSHFKVTDLNPNIILINSDWKCFWITANKSFFYFGLFHSCICEILLVLIVFSVQSMRLCLI